MPRHPRHLLHVLQRLHVTTNREDTVKIVTGADLPDLSFAHPETFDLAKVEPIRNDLFVKPLGGVWLSPPGAWVQWCRGEDWDEPDAKVDQPFDRALLADHKFVVIDTLQDLKDLMVFYEYEWPTERKAQFGLLSEMRFLDFEALACDFDGIYLTDAGQWATRLSDPKLYGWDLESVLWFGTSEGRF